MQSCAVGGGVDVMLIWLFIGSSTWSDAAMQTFQALAMGRLVEAFVVGYNVDDLTPVIELFTTDENNMASDFTFILH